MSEILNSFYICHHCLTYKSSLKTDVIRHLNKKNKCKNNSNFSFEESQQCSHAKKYIFTFDINTISIHNLNFILSSYKEAINYIHEDYNNIHNIQLNKNKIEDNSDKSKKLQCPRCDKNFSSKQNLLKHYKNKTICDNNIFYNKILEEHKNKELNQNFL